MYHSSSADASSVSYSWFQRAWRQVRAAFSARQDGSIKDAIEEAIEEVLEEREEQADALAPEEKNILRNALSFGDIAVQDIMTPRMDIQAVPSNITLPALKQHIMEQQHTRIPVYAGTLDQVEGFLHIKDVFTVLAGEQPFDLKRLLRPMVFVPPSMRLSDLLVKMRRSGSHMAIVVDEHGGTDGLVTLEDVFEEIVGEIHDEHDDDEGERRLVRVGQGMYEVDARLPIERLEAALGTQFSNTSDEEQFDTVGGLIFFELGRVPAVGEVVKHRDTAVRFEVIGADARRIHRVRVDATHRAEGA